MRNVICVLMLIYLQSYSRLFALNVSFCFHVFKHSFSKFTRFYLSSIISTDVISTKVSRCRFIEFFSQNYNYNILINLYITRKLFGTVTSVLQFFLPFFLILVCYLSIFCKLQRNKKKLSKSKNSKKKFTIEKSLRKKTSTNQMLVLMVSCCWLLQNIFPSKFLWDSKKNFIVMRIIEILIRLFRDFYFLIRFFVFLIRFYLFSYYFLCVLIRVFHGKFVCKSLCKSSIYHHNFFLGRNFWRLLVAA